MAKPKSTTSINHADLTQEALLDKLQQEMRECIDKTHCEDGPMIQYLFELMLFPGASYYNRHLIDSCERACRKPVAELQSEIANRFTEDALCRNALSVRSISDMANNFVRELPPMWLRELWVWLRMRTVIAGILTSGGTIHAVKGMPKYDPDVEMGAACHFVRMTEETWNVNFEGYHEAMEEVEAAGVSKSIAAPEGGVHRDPDHDASKKMREMETAEDCEPPFDPDEWGCRPW